MIAAQRYSSPVAQARMAAGTCPECGRSPGVHGNDVRFWMPVNQVCDLLDRGVVERIEQYRADLGHAREAR